MKNKMEFILNKIHRKTIIWSTFTYNPTIKVELAFSAHEPFIWSEVSVNICFTPANGQSKSLKNVMLCFDPIEFLGRVVKIA